MPKRSSAALQTAIDMPDVILSLLLRPIKHCSPKDEVGDEPTRPARALARGKQGPGLDISPSAAQPLLDCGTTPTEVSRDIGVHHSVLFRFLSGKRGMSLDALDRLAKRLKLRLVRDED